MLNYFRSNPADKEIFDRSDLYASEGEYPRCIVIWHHKASGMYVTHIEVIRSDRVPHLINAEYRSALHAAMEDFNSRVERLKRGRTLCPSTSTESEN